MRSKTRNILLGICILLAGTAASIAQAPVNSLGSGSAVVSGTVTATQGSPPWTVQGNVANGSADTSNQPVQVAGHTGAGNVKTVNVEATSGSINTWFVTTAVDAMANSSGIGMGLGNNSAVLAAMGGYSFNGTTWDRRRNASLADFPASSTTTGRNSIGAAIAEKGSRWSVVSAPAAASAASASIALESSVRHVADCVSFSATASAAITTQSWTLVIRDGATGAGTVIWEYLVNPVSTGTGAQSVQAHSICGLNLVGTTGTAMTAEFSAGVANVSQAVSLSGYNVN